MNEFFGRISISGTSISVQHFRDPKEKENDVISEDRIFRSVEYVVTRYYHHIKGLSVNGVL